MIFKRLAGKAPPARGLLSALALSCALHVLLLWPDALPRMTQQAGRPLTATLRVPVAVSSPALPTSSGPSEKTYPEAKTDPQQRVVAKTDPVTMAAPSAAASPRAMGSASLGGDTGILDRNPGAQEEAPARPDVEGIRAYRIGLAREARAYRHYPALARERGWTGTAEVRVDVSHEGQPRQVLLARSSGHDILDREAVQMMSRAAASAALPESLRGRAFAVRLPVVFDIPDVQ